MTIPQPQTSSGNDQSPNRNPDYTVLDHIIAELHELEERKQTLMADRDSELRRLRRANISVSELRERAGLSKSMVRLITTPPRGV